MNENRVTLLYLNRDRNIESLMFSGQYFPNEREQ